MWSVPYRGLWLSREKGHTPQNRADTNTGEKGHKQTKTQTKTEDFRTMDHWEAGEKGESLANKTNYSRNDRMRTDGQLLA